MIFASDHGEMLGDLGRLSKSVFFESALRVPLIICLPDGGDDSSTCSALVETIDIHATILDVAGCEIEAKKDCVLLLPLVRRERDAVRDDVLSEVHAHYMLRTENEKLVVGRNGEALQLFDREQDPLEQHNLAGHPDTRLRELEMRSRLLARITRDTLRLGRLDPEYCAHALPETDGACS